MAHMKQQIKRYKNDYKKHAKNVAFKSALKTEIKKVLAAVEAGNKEEHLCGADVAFLIIPQHAQKVHCHQRTANAEKAGGSTGDHRADNGSGNIGFQLEVFGEEDKIYSQRHQKQRKV